MRLRPFWRLAAQAWGTPLLAVGPMAVYSACAATLLLLAFAQPSFDSVARNLFLVPPVLLLPITTLIFVWERQTGLDRLLANAPVRPGLLVASRLCAALLWAVLLAAALLPAQALAANAFGPMAWRELPALLGDFSLVASASVGLGALLGLCVRSRPLAAIAAATGWAGGAVLLFLLGLQEELLGFLLRPTPLHASAGQDGLVKAIALLAPPLLVAWVAALAARRADVRGWTSARAGGLASLSMGVAVVLLGVVPPPALAEEGVAPDAKPVATVHPPPLMEKGRDYAVLIEGSHRGTARVVDASGRLLGSGSVEAAGEGSLARFHLDSAPATGAAPVLLLVEAGGRVLVVEPPLLVAGGPADKALLFALLGAAPLPAGSAYALRMARNRRRSGR